MKKILFIFVTGLLMAACTKNEERSAVDEAWAAWVADSASLKIAVMPTIDCLPLFVADEYGYFERESVSVSLYPYMAQMDCDTALTGGWVDGMMTDLVRAERMQQQGTALHYATTTALAWQLLTGHQARISRLKQLDDKMVAMTRYSATALLADMLVDSAGLQSERVFRIQVNDVNVRLRMLQTGVMDALLLPEPQATVARLSEARVLYDTRQTGINLGVLVFSESALADSLRHTQMEGMMRAYAAACDTINERGISTYKDLVVRCCGVSAEAVDSMSLDWKYPGVQPPSPVDVERARRFLMHNN